MIVLDSGDKIRGDASAASVVDYSFHGLDNNTLKQLADGQLSDSTGDLYTADSLDLIKTFVLVNTDTSARTINLYLLPSGGTARRLIPKDLSLGAGYSLCFAGTQIVVMDTAGNIITSFSNLISDTAYGAGWNGVITIAPSKNAVYDEMELRTKAAAVIADNKLVRGDGGAKGVQECTIVVSDSGEMTNPSQPAFNVKPSVKQENIALVTEVTIVFGAERFDQGNNFASNIFTAPITGKYQLNVAIRLEAVDTLGTHYQIRIVTSNATYSNMFDPKFSADANQLSKTLTIVADMDANDTVFVAVYQAAGTVQTDISVGSYFSGALIC